MTETFAIIANRGAGKSSGAGDESSPRHASAAAEGPALGKAQRVILSVLATYGSRSIASVAVLSGYSAGGGGFRNALSALRTAGLIEGRGDLMITAAGRDAVGLVDPLPTGADLRQHWKSQPALGKAHGFIIDELADAHPHSLAIAELAQRTGYAADGGGFRNAISRLRTLGLDSRPGRGQARRRHVRPVITRELERPGKAMRSSGSATTCTHGTPDGPP